jgi:single-strand DNA-binding protein
MQQITIAGRIGRDAELRTTQAGDKVCSFSVAVDARDGREKITNWWRVSVWGKRGEALAQYLTKGASVTVAGEFSLGEFDGKPQLNVRASEIALQGGKQDSGERQPQREERTPARAGGGGDGSGFGNLSGGFNSRDDLDDEIPFISARSVW